MKTRSIVLEVIRSMTLCLLVASATGCDGCCCKRPPRDAPAPRFDGFAHNGLIRNALSIRGVASNAQLLDRLRDNPLSSDAVRLAGDLVRRSEDPPLTRTLLQYFAECALSREQTLRVGNDEFQGAVALCPDWSTRVPTEACQEVVTACLLARVNPRGRRVLISMRRPSGSAPEIPLANRVPVQDYYREDPNTRIPSLAPCSGSVRADDKDRNCGWSPGYVGSCKDGTEVKLTVTSATQPMLRVCKGIHGCDHDADPISEPNPPPYAGEIESWSPGEAGYGIFECPTEGLSSGYYSVMLSSPTSLTDTDPPPDTYTISGEGYPASEADVFKYREGTFYGNVFHPSTRSAISALTRGGSSPENDMLAGALYACHSDRWLQGVAHMADRFCADPDENKCFQNVPGMCYQGDGTRPPGDGTLCAQAGQCGGAAGIPAADSCYTSCKGTGFILCDGADPGQDACTSGTPRQWQNGITVYLNHPCDLSAASDGSCGYDTKHFKEP